MFKVVYNDCYGGFSLSLKAVEWLESNCKDNELRDFIKLLRLAGKEYPGVTKMNVFATMYLTGLRINDTTKI